MEYTFTINGKLPTINEYNNAQRGDKYKASRLKREYERLVMFSLVRPRPAFIKPVVIEYRFFEENKKRDLDNISAFAHKIVQDALVHAGVLKNDGWQYVRGFSDSFFIDRERPRIEVTIKEVE